MSSRRGGTRFALPSVDIESDKTSIVAMKRRFPKFAYWLAGVYLAYSLLVYFGSLWSKGDAHSWWPVFLYPVIWPWSAAVGVGKFRLLGVARSKSKNCA